MNRAPDPQKAHALRQDVRFDAWQKLTDIQAQRAVRVVGYRALDVLKKAGRALNPHANATTPFANTRGQCRAMRDFDPQVQHGTLVARIDPSDRSKSTQLNGVAGVTTGTAEVLLPPSANSGAPSASATR